jgi:hypothetical protein
MLKKGAVAYFSSKNTVSIQMLYEKKLNIFCQCESDFFKINVFSQCEIEIWGYFLAILWIFSGFLEKWWFFLCESALENKISAIRNGIVPFRIRKAFVYLQ